MNQKEEGKRSVIEILSYPNTQKMTWIKRNINSSFISKKCTKNSLFLTLS